MCIFLKSSTKSFRIAISERWTFHPSKECGIAIGFPHETNQFGSFVLPRKGGYIAGFWNYISKKNSNKRNTNTKKTNKYLLVGWCKKFLRSFFCELCWGSEAATTDDTQAFERRFDFISPRNSTSWWDLNGYPRPSWRLLTSLPSVLCRAFWHSYSKNMDMEKNNACRKPLIYLGLSPPGLLHF